MKVPGSRIDLLILAAMNIFLVLAIIFSYVILYR